MWTIVPTSPSHVFNMTSDTAAIEGRASPLKPREDIFHKSSSVYNLLVACLWKANGASSLFIPIPLSVTIISRIPASFKSILIFVALASTEFSTNSFTIDTTFSTTSPAAILFDSSSFITLILFIVYLNHFIWFIHISFFFIDSYFSSFMVY